MQNFAIKFYACESYSVAQTRPKKSRHFISPFTVTEQPFFHCLRLLLWFLFVKVAAGSTSTFWAVLSPNRKAQWLPVHSLLPASCVGRVCGFWLGSYSTGSFLPLLGRAKSTWSKHLVVLHRQLSSFLELYNFVSKEWDKECDFIASLNIILWVQCRSIHSAWCSCGLEQACFALLCSLSELERRRLCVLAVLFFFAV